jgi:SAM-dependent methyltransferase
MRNTDLWKPTKIVRGAHGFQPSPDARFVAVSSRLMVSCLIEHYQGVIQKYASGRLLDLGCGFVPYYEFYKNLVSEVICVDWENSLHKNDFLDHFMDLNKPLSLASESFDTVLLTDVLEHIYQPVQLLSEVARVLRPSGHVIIGVPFFYGLHEEPFDFHRYTEFSLRQMSADLGLEIKSLIPYGGVPEILLDITGKCLNEAGLARLCRLHAATADALMKLRLVRAVSSRTAHGFPLGYVLAAQKT